MARRTHRYPNLTRRSFLQMSAGALASAWTGSACGPTPIEYEGRGAARGLELAPTPSCADGRAPVTAAQIEGPYYTPRTPLRSSLIEPSLSGPRLHLVGRVLDPECNPIPGAVLDFWQADADGVYDNEGFRLRGHQFSDASGHYSLETIVPGAYSDGWFRRTPHLHAKTQGPSSELLTTQLYFPDQAAQNRDDGIYDPALLMAREANGPPDTLTLRFDFVLSPSSAS